MSIVSIAENRRPWFNEQKSENDYFVVYQFINESMSLMWVKSIFKTDKKIAKNYRTE